METTDLTIEILKGIREEQRTTNAQVREKNLRLDETNVRLDETNAQLAQLREELSRRIVESEIRTATAMTALSGDVRELVSFLRQTNDLRPRLERCEEDIVSIKQRLA